MVKYWYEDLVFSSIVETDPILFFRSQCLDQLEIVNMFLESSLEFHLLNCPKLFETCVNTPEFFFILLSSGISMSKLHLRI